MRNLAIILCLLAVASCTRPSSDFTFVDLTRAASADLREFQSWVEADPEREFFPERLCLAGILLEASLADTSSTGGSIGVPLAAASGGVTGMLGYDFTLTEQGADKIRIPMLAVYGSPPKLKKTKEGEDDLDKFIKEFRGKFPEYRKERDLDNLRDKPLREVRLPVPYKNNRSGFDARTDLAVELWRIREGIHDMVVNSPEAFLLAPGDLRISREYRLINSGGPSIDLKFAGAGTLNASKKSTATEINRLDLVYVINKSFDITRCNSKSIGNDDVEEVTSSGTSNLPAPPS